MKRLRHAMSAHEPGTARSPADIVRRRSSGHAIARTNRALAGGQDRQGEVVLDQAAFRRLVLLDGRLHHRAEGGLGGGISRAMVSACSASPASTGSVIPVT